MNAPIRFAFAGDRDIAVDVLRHLRSEGYEPLALPLRPRKRASHGAELEALCPHLDESERIRGSRFRSPQGLQALRELDLDFIVGVHFPYIVPAEVLAIPKRGVLNLPPAFLPFNRGWHTPSWALLEKTPIGATLHYMDEGVDSGDIVAQRRVEPQPNDTADSLYRRVKRAEYDLFVDSWPRLVDGSAERHSHDPNAGTSHKKEELLSDEKRKIELDEPTSAAELLRRLRAHTTNDPTEALFFDADDGKRYRVRIEIEAID